MPDEAELVTDEFSSFGSTQGHTRGPARSRPAPQPAAESVNVACLTSNMVDGCGLGSSEPRDCAGRAPHSRESNNTTLLWDPNDTFLFKGFKVKIEAKFSVKK